MLENINALQIELRDKIEELNSGGCIYFAYYFSKRLRELQIPHKIVFCDYSKYLPDLIKKEVAMNHVMVHINNIGYIDGHDTFKTKKTVPYRCIEKRSLKQVNLDNFINNGCWSNCYDKNDNIYLESAINKYIS